MPREQVARPSRHGCSREGAHGRPCGVGWSELNGRDPAGTRPGRTGGKGSRPRERQVQRPVSGVRCSGTTHRAVGREVRWERPGGAWSHRAPGPGGGSGVV